VDNKVVAGMAMVGKPAVILYRFILEGWTAMDVPDADPFPAEK
jgi:hypothetical protein